MLEYLFDTFRTLALQPLVQFVVPMDYQEPALYILETLIKIVAILAPLMIGVAYLTYAERKVIGYIKSRIGPNRVVFFGYPLW